MTRQNTDFRQTVSAIAVIDLANELLERKCIGPDDIADLGHQFGTLYQMWRCKESVQEKRLPEHLLINLWQKVADVDDSIGIQIGSKVNLKAKGLLANWLSQSETLAEAFVIFSENIELLNPSECWTSSVEEGTKAKLSIRFLSPEYPDVAIDRSMAAMIAWSRSLCGSQISPARISLTRPAPTLNEDFANLTTGEIAYQQQENAAWFSLEDFNRPVTGANQYLKNLLEKQAMTHKKQVGKTEVNSTTRTIKTMLSHDLARFCQLTNTTNYLHLSRSNLYRKLKKEGTSFTELVKEERLCRLSPSTLAELSTLEITEALGFRDIGSYYRFRKQVELT